MLESGQSEERVLTGIAASPGVAHAPALVLSQGGPEALPKHTVAEAELEHQVQRFKEALALTRDQILAVQREVRERLGGEEAEIFDAHLLVLDDPVIIQDVHRTILQDKVAAEYAVQQVTHRYIQALDAVPDEFLRERAADMRDVVHRVLHNLTGSSPDAVLRNLPHPCILVAPDLTPSQTAVLDRKKVLAFATDIGSKTSHAAILARSLGIPAVVGLGTASQTLQTGDDLLVDGEHGVLILNPTTKTLVQFGELARRRVTMQEALRGLRAEPAVTLDGVRVGLAANIETADDTAAVLDSGAEGIGLFRTEFLFLGRDHLPSEEEQYQTYREVARAVQPHPVVIRTLDLGGDKFIAHVPVPKEVNPFLGWRAIRFCLQQKEIFSGQIRAILRASAEGNVRMMYPMISGVEELRQANALVEACKEELRQAQIPFDPEIEIGAMIELPSAALTAEALAKQVRFFSLGTNDLIQYTLAVDRLNEKIAHLYDPTHPAILRLIRLTAEAGVRRGIRVGVCGEMGGEPALTGLLLGLGVTEFSVALPQVGRVKHMIRHLRMDDARGLAAFALSCESSAEILARCEAFARERAPTLFEEAG